MVPPEAVSVSPDPAGPLEVQTVEEVFVRYGQILHVHVGGQVIRTTAEHPFWVEVKGWTAAAELSAGDRLLGHDGQWVEVEEVYDTGEYERVYNLRVSEYHTYFVGSLEWGFSVWAHNAYKEYMEAMQKEGATGSRAAINKHHTRTKNLSEGDQRKAFERYIAKQLGKDVTDPKVQEIADIAMAQNTGQKGGRLPNLIGQAGEQASSRYYGPKNHREWDVPGYGGAKPDHVLAVDPKTSRPTAVVEAKNQPYYYKSSQIEAYLRLVGRDGIVIVAVPKSGATIAQTLIDTPGVHIARVLPAQQSE